MCVGSALVTEVNSESFLLCATHDNWVELVVKRGLITKNTLLRVTCLVITCHTYVGKACVISGLFLTESSIQTLSYFCSNGKLHESFALLACCPECQMLDA